jgi:ribonuclease H / adenosylcobalamin/alpha-ribazole phosphatase
LSYSAVVRAFLHTDGGARGNPGPAGIGVLLRDEDGVVIEEVARAIGETTNNVAEYEALIAGLKLAAERGISEVDVYLDSELVVSQLEGRWKIKNDRLRSLAVAARALMGRFERVTVNHVPRGQNAHADRLANLGMDEAQVHRASDGPIGQQSF